MEPESINVGYLDPLGLAAKVICCLLSDCTCQPAILRTTGRELGGVLDICGRGEAANSESHASGGEAAAARLPTSLTHMWIVLKTAIIWVPILFFRF